MSHKHTLVWFSFFLTVMLIITAPQNVWARRHGEADCFKTAPQATPANRRLQGVHKNEVPPPQRTNSPDLSGSVIIDPGHGGSDQGAVGFGGTREKDVALAVSLEVRQILVSRGIPVVMTRETDRDVAPYGSDDVTELAARSAVANRKGGFLFVSIHCNAFSGSEANGVETYYYPKSHRDSRLAEILYDELLVASNLRGRGVKEANFYVLKHTAVPASLVELAFITNPREEALLRNAAFRQKIAASLANGIIRYLNLEKGDQYDG